MTAALTTTTQPVASERQCIFANTSLIGTLNVTDETLVAQVASAIRRQHPQLCPQPINRDQVCLVGGGPSLAETERELVDLLNAGAKLVTVNGSYAWALARNLRPSAQIVVDARPGNSKFVQPALPECRYWLASQCAPDVWDAVEGRPWVAIWHTTGPDNALLKPILDAYYLKNWVALQGGSTVTIRAIGLLRALGYIRLHLFGVDSCYLDGAHHAYPQAENDGDSRHHVRVGPVDHPELDKDFIVAPWHLTQADDFIRFVRAFPDSFNIYVHGRGLIAHLLDSGAEVPVLADADTRPADSVA